LRSILRLSIVLVALTLPLLLWLASVQNTLPPPARGALVDLSHPDVLIVSEELSALPRELLRIPLLHDVLTEDFAFYYEHNPQRDMLAGTLRRLAFEHEPTLPDRLIETLLARPARLALWRGPNGAPRYWMLVLDTPAMAGLMEAMARIALDDTQLSRAGELTIGRVQETLYAIRLDDRRTLLVAFHGHRMLVMSDPAMLVGPTRGPRPSLRQDARQALAAALLSGEDQALFDAFDLNDGTARHRIAARADFLAFGYQPFFPAIEAVRADFNGRAWSAGLRANLDQMPDPQPVWTHLPGRAAACFALPVQWPTLGALATRNNPEADVQPAVAALAGPMGLCWYPEHALATPLAVAALGPGDAARQARPAFEKLFATVVGAAEPAHPDGRFPVEAAQADDGLRLSRVVSSVYGNHAPSELADSGQLAARRYFAVSLLADDSHVAASPDDSLVDDAVAVGEHRLPSAAEGAAGGLLLARIRPAALAQLLETEVMRALPEDREPVFHGVAQAQLLPRLEALAAHPPFDITVDAGPGGMRWHALRWEAPAQ